MLFYVLVRAPKLALLNICSKKLSNTTNMCKIATDMKFFKCITPARFPSFFNLPRENIYFEHLVSLCTQIQTYSSYFVKPITINKSCQQMIQKFWVIPRNFTRGKTFYTSAARDDRDKLNRKGIKLWFPWNNLPKLTYKIILNFYSCHINLIINYDCYVKNIHISDWSISISLEPLSFSYHTYRNFPSHLTSPTC